MKAFIVFGRTGEYSDRGEWPVRGFLDAAKAEAFEFESTKRAKVFFDEYNSLKYTEVWDEAQEAIRKFDPGFRCDYTGTDYYTIDVEIES